MSDLKHFEKKFFEKLFRMESGYFLDMSNRELKLFFVDYGIDIYSDAFSEYGDSKANRVRAFWKIANNACVIKVHHDLLKMMNMDSNHFYKVNDIDMKNAEEILCRLEQKPDSRKKYPKVKTSQERHSSHTALKEGVLSIARELWKENPNLSQSDIMRKNLFKEKLKNLCEALNIQVKEETIRKWLREVDPRNQENKPGPNKRVDFS